MPLHGQIGGSLGNSKQSWARARTSRQNSLPRNTRVTTALGVDKHRHPQASPLFRLVEDHLHRLQSVYDESFARAYGPWRSVLASSRIRARGRAPITAENNSRLVAMQRSVIAPRPL